MKIRNFLFVLAIMSTTFAVNIPDSYGMRDSKSLQSVSESLGDKGWGVDAWKAVGDGITSLAEMAENLIKNVWDFFKPETKPPLTDWEKLGSHWQKLIESWERPPSPGKLEYDLASAMRSNPARAHSLINKYYEEHGKKISDPTHLFVTLLDGLAPRASFFDQFDQNTGAKKVDTSQSGAQRGAAESGETQEAARNKQKNCQAIADQFGDTLRDIVKRGLKPIASHYKDGIDYINRDMSGFPVKGEGVKWARDTYLSKFANEKINKMLSDILPSIRETLFLKDELVSCRENFSVNYINNININSGKNEFNETNTACKDLKMTLVSFLESVHSYQQMFRDSSVKKPIIEKYEDQLKKSGYSPGWKEVLESVKKSLADVDGFIPKNPDAVTNLCREISPCLQQYCE